MESQAIAEYVAYAIKLAAAGKTSIQGEISENEPSPTVSSVDTLLKERRLFSLAMQICFDGVIMGDPNGNIVFINNAILEMFKGTSENFIGKSVLDFLPEREKQRAIQLSLNAMSTGEGYLSEFSALKMDGSEIQVEVAASVVKENGQAIGFIDIVRSITERKKIEESLKKQAALIDLSPSAIIIKDATERITFWSKGAEKLYGFSQEEAIGQDINNLLKVKNTESGKDIFAQLRDREHWIGEVTHQTKENVEVVVQTDWLAIIDDRGDISEILESNVDITAHKRAEEKALKTAEERYLKAERLAAIGQLAGMVGHDLRNPLAGIKNAVYLLRKKQASSLDATGNQMLDTIDQAVEHADSIISDLLDYSREINLQLEVFSSKCLISYVFLSVTIPKNIKVSDKTEDYFIRVDGNKIQRVFVNFIKNSFDAMPDGGKLEISSNQDSGYVNFVFSDTGTGMSKEVSEKIFTPLFTTKAQGMGLGLAICKRFIEAHKGKISVQSIPNKATAFTVSLPIHSTETDETVANA